MCENCEKEDRTNKTWPQIWPARSLIPPKQKSLVQSDQNEPTAAPPSGQNEPTAGPALASHLLPPSLLCSSCGLGCSGTVQSLLWFSSIRGRSYGAEPKALCTQGIHSSTELCPQLWVTGSHLALFTSANLAQITIHPNSCGHVPSWTLTRGFQSTNLCRANVTGVDQSSLAVYATRTLGLFTDTAKPSYMEMIIHI